MRSRFHMSAMILAAASLVGLSPLPRSEPAPRSPEPRPPRPLDGPSTAYSKRRKRERKAERERLKGGIPGAGLWRKCRAGGRVRGW